MPVVTPTRLPLVHALLEWTAICRRDAALAGVVAAALLAAAVVVTLGPLPAEALRHCG